MQDGQELHLVYIPNAGIIDDPAILARNGAHRGLRLEVSGCNSFTLRENQNCLLPHCGYPLFEVLHRAWHRAPIPSDGGWVELLVGTNDFFEPGGDIRTAHAWRYRFNPFTQSEDAYGNNALQCERDALRLAIPI